MRMITLNDMAAILRFVGLCLAVAVGASALGEDRSTHLAVEQTQGTVEGIVTYQSDRNRPWRYARYYVKDRKTGELAEAVVSLRGTAGDRDGEQPGPATVVIDQKDFRFIPETVAIRAGDRVTFKNSDAAVHNVYVSDPANAFNVNMPAGGQHSETFNTAGGIGRPMQVGCVYHSSMRAWVYVFNHPHFQVTEPDGRFALKHVPPGKYTVDVVHPAGKLRWSKEIEVTAGTPVTLQIELSPNNVVKSIRSRKPNHKPAASSPSEESK